MSGFSGIYGMAVDPRFNDVIACDAELDRLYRINTFGEIIKTFELSSLGDFNPYKKMFENWTWTAISPSTDSWSDVTASADVWTEVTSSNDIWLRQG